MRKMARKLSFETKSPEIQTSDAKCLKTGKREDELFQVGSGIEMVAMPERGSLAYRGPSYLWKGLHVLFV